MRPPSDDVLPRHRVSALPVCVALGLAVLLVGLVVDTEVLAPVGGAVALLGSVVWARRRLGVSDYGVPRPASAVETPDERFPRSRLLEVATIGLGGVIATAVAVPVAALSIVASFLGPRRRDVDLGPLEAFPEGQFVLTTFLLDPTMGEVSRRTAFIRNNGLLGNLPSFTILSSRCTHVGCPTQPNGPILLAQRQVERGGGGEVSLVPTTPSGFGCPCHGSQFDNEGNRTAGPAPRALDRYGFSIRHGRLAIGRLYTVSHVDGTGATAEIHAADTRGAGQPVTGIESWLYPVAPGS